MPNAQCPMPNAQCPMPNALFWVTSSVASCQRFTTESLTFNRRQLALVHGILA
ncbi:hypothetical protein [Nostoc sp. NOS(2021)]|uniref:hypothetical protein n=1 Tax=Nostoc sp. NOS(2021) TaxID=2815407 RepID=UPI0025E0E484|nr:hypothetical protein [Nostoc sp. NOS(2021)]